MNKLSLDINDQMLGRWVKAHQQSEDGQAFRGNGKLTRDQGEIKRLKSGYMSPNDCARKLIEMKKPA